MSDLLLAFVVPGQARPAGSKVSGAVYRKGADGRPVPVTNPNGRVKTFTKDSSGEAGAAWRADVRRAAQEAIGDAEGFPLDGVPLELSIAFFRPRPKGHWRTGRNAHLLRDDAPEFPLSRPDVLKLARAVEDALTGTVWTDDAAVVREVLSKEFGRVPEARVEVRRGIRLYCPDPSQLLLEEVPK